MDAREPMVALDARFSSPDATPRMWPEARAQLEQAEVFWLSTAFGFGKGDRFSQTRFRF